jgi:hypothetical protein
MRRRLLIGLLGLGTVVGFGSGLASLFCAGGYGRHHAWHRRAAFEQHVADLCTQAALRTQKK